MLFDENMESEEVMAHEENDRFLTFATGMVLGGMVGAGLALLLAPRSGRRTRRKLRHTAEDWSDKAEARLQHAAEDARRAASRSGEKMKREMDRGREKLNL